MVYVTAMPHPTVRHMRKTTFVCYTCHQTRSYMLSSLMADAYAAVSGRDAKVVAEKRAGSITASPNEAGVAALLDCHQSDLIGEAVGGDRIAVRRHIHIAHDVAPAGIGQLWNFSVPGSKRTMVFGLARDLLYQSAPWWKTMP